MEYKEFAKYYDKFYQNKDYKKEVKFLSEILDLNSTVLDVGCGTGIHASLLEKVGYKVDILDLNEEMLEIAKTRVTGDAYNQNMLELNLNKKYDAIICMFAVINHLSDTSQLESVLFNFKNHLKSSGKIIMDLHNPQSSGQKEDFIDNMKRTMIWNYDSSKKVEESDIVFEIDGTKYVDKHVFKIFNIDEVTKVCEKVGMMVIAIYENYTFNNGNVYSKNLQFIISN